MSFFKVNLFSKARLCPFNGTNHEFQLLVDILYNRNKDQAVEELMSILIHDRQKGINILRYLNIANMYYISQRLTDKVQLANKAKCDLPELCKCIKKMAASNQAAKEVYFGKSKEHGLENHEVGLQKFMIINKK